MKDLENLELKISKFLRLGVIVAGIFMLIGWLASFDPSSNPFVSFAEYDKLPLQYAIAIYYQNQQWGVLISYVGLFCLISLPIIRVLLTSIIFIKQKELTLASIAGVVLVGLVLSFVLGIEI
jgi:uncharacterized membrane protein